MRKCLGALAMALLAAVPAGAGTTKSKTSLAPLQQDCRQIYACLSGTCVGTGATCAVDADCTACSIQLEQCGSNADCGYGLVSPSSSVQITGTGQVKISAKGVKGPGGVPVTTDGIAGTADDYIVQVSTLGFPANTTLFLKLDLDQGNGKLTADISGQFAAADAALIPVVSLRRPPLVPADCPGTNSPADLASRGNDIDCDSGATIAVGGLTSGF